MSDAGFWGYWPVGILPAFCVVTVTTGMVIALPCLHKRHGQFCRHSLSPRAGQEMADVMVLRCSFTSRGDGPDVIPCNMCAGAIVHFGIIKVVYGEFRNLPEDNGRELLVRYGVEPARPGPRGGQADAQGLH